MNQLTLHTRQGTHHVPVELDVPIVQLAKKHKIAWGYSCERGICAQCRTKVNNGTPCLNGITEAEKLRLRKAERQEGFRLACQIKIKEAGEIELTHQPY